MDKKYLIPLTKELIVTTDLVGHLLIVEDLYQNEYPRPTKTYIVGSYEIYESDNEVYCDVLEIDAIRKQCTLCSTFIRLDCESEYQRVFLCPKGREKRVCPSELTLLTSFKLFQRLINF